MTDQLAVNDDIISLSFADNVSRMMMPMRCVDTKPVSLISCWLCTNDSCAVVPAI